MKTAIMQPYFLPYIGYFQLIQSADVFILYDNIKYTKKGWINRNRMLSNGKDVVFSLPLKGASDALDVRERELATDFDPQKLLNQMAGAYRRAPYFSEVFPWLEEVLRHQDHNLYAFLYHSVVATCRYLDITTEIRRSSDVAADHGLKGQERVLALCDAVGASVYINAIGGVELYSREEFQRRGITLRFIKSRPFEYGQFGGEFIPWLSIVDVLMFNPLAHVQERVRTGYKSISSS